MVSSKTTIKEEHYGIGYVNPTENIKLQTNTAMELLSIILGCSYQELEQLLSLVELAKVFDVQLEEVMYDPLDYKRLIRRLLTKLKETS